MKLAYALLNKIGSHKEGTSIMTGDRVSRHIAEFRGCSLIGKGCLINSNAALHLVHTFINRHLAANNNMLLNPKCQKVLYIQGHLMAFDIMSVLVCSLTDVYNLCHW